MVSEETNTHQLTMLSFYEQHRLTSRYWASFAILCAGLCLDYFDFFIVGFLVASISASCKLTYLQSSIMLLSCGIGALLGSIIFGVLGDKYGCKPILIIATIICSFGDGSLALVPDGS